MGLGMAGGMALATCMLSNPEKKKKMQKMMQDVKKDASVFLDDMSQSLKQE